jgi:predicted RNA-binding Zn-ribbon protein involved in translation (DUF1610 family)
MDFDAPLPQPRPPPSPVEDARQVDLESLPRCPGCGYVLYKLTTLRCPECGRVIRPMELRLRSADTRQLERQARLQALMTVAGAALLIGGAALVFYASRHLRLVGPCFAIPLVALTLITVGFRLLCGESVHGLLLVLGLVWLVGGVLTALAV